MDRQEKVELLRAIMAELKKPLPAIAHSIRELPGTKDLYIYLSWERVRDRLDEVVPDYELSFSMPEYSIEANTVTCITTVTILDISKQALASVPIQQLNKNTGKDMSRGGCIDRLHAEGIKNAAEAWGVGRYLEDQYSVYKSIWEARSQFPSELRGKIEQMKAQFTKQARATETAIPKPATPKLATPKPTTSTTPTLDKGLYPQHNNIIKKLRSHLSLSPERVLALSNGRYPSALNPVELQQLELDMVIDWAVASKAFQSAEVARSAAQSALPQWLNEGYLYDESLLSWVEILQKPLTSH